MKECCDNVTTGTRSLSSNDQDDYQNNIELYLDDYCNSDGVEAYQICESGPVVFALTSKEIVQKALHNSVGAPPSLPPEIRSPTIGTTKRFIYDLGPSSNTTPSSTSSSINDDIVNNCPPIPTVSFSPSMERCRHDNDDTIKPIISESFSTDCSLQPLSRKEQAIPSSVNCNTLVLANSKDSDHYLSQWCSQCCMHALSEINETCSNIIYAEDTNTDSASCADDVEGCLMACLGDCFDMEKLRGKRLFIENNITNMLGSSSTFDSSKCTSKTKRSYRKTISNRACKLNAQARRLRRLRNEMTFIQSVKTKHQSMRWIQTTQSDDEDSIDTLDETISTGAGNNNVYLSNCSTALTTIDNDDVTTSSRSLLSAPMLTNSITSHTSSTSQGSNDLYYDSDPGEIKLRILSQKNSRRASIEKLDYMNETEIWNKTNPPKQTELSCETTKDENKFIQIISNGRMNLVWHPTSTHDINLSPICVQSWIESGSRLNHNSQFIQPKFMWKRGYYEIRHKSFFRNNPYCAIDLLDICRVLPTTSINRSMHPYAKKSCSFTVETHTDLYLFECRDGKERDEIVLSLKLVVARLASQLIVGDSNVYREFFSGVGSVPGEAIDWNAIASGSA